MKKLVLSLAVMGVFLVGCSQEKKESNATVTQSSPVAAQEEKTAAVEKAKEEMASVTKAEEKSVIPAEELKKEVVTAVETATTTAVNEAEEKAQTVTQALEEAPVAINQKGIDLYVKCAACHGKNGEKKALGTSQVIKGWSVEQTVSSLKGYKNKTYGGSMKTVMTSQVVTLSDEDIDAVAQLIATF